MPRFSRPVTPLQRRALKQKQAFRQALFKKRYAAGLIPTNKVKTQRILQALRNTHQNNPGEFKARRIRAAHRKIDYLLDHNLPLPYDPHDPNGNFRRSGYRQRKYNLPPPVVLNGISPFRQDYLKWRSTVGYPTYRNYR